MFYDIYINLYFENNTIQQAIDRKKNKELVKEGSLKRTSFFLYGDILASYFI